MVLRPRALLSMAAVGALALLLIPGIASADIPIEGQHSQTIVVKLDFGGYADYATGVYTVVKGDTLQAIAQAKLGAASRWNEITKLNPDVKPKKLVVGAQLRLPPTKAPLPPPPGETKGEAKAPKAATGRQHWWHIVSMPRLGTKLVPFGHGQSIPVGNYGASVYAIRNDKFAHFESLVAKDKRGIHGVLQSFKKQRPSWFAEADGLRVGRSSTQDNDPVWRIENTTQITRIEAGRIHTKVLRSRYFDGKGKELSPADIGRAKRNWNVLLLLLAGGGILGLYFVVRRRLAAAPEAARSSTPSAA